MNSFLSLPVFALFLTLITGCKDKPDILVVTGGHDFDTADFFNIFISSNEFSVDTVSQPSGNLLLENISPDKYDAIVFYDMWQDISQSQKDAYQGLLENGTGMIFLHHSLVSYQEWDEFTSIRGGKYREWGYGENLSDSSDSSDLSDSSGSSGLSGYKHGLDLQVKVIDPDHPVTKGITDFEIKDEGYYNVEILPSVTPLLGTSHPSCAPYVAWTNEYKKSRIVYIMLGHNRYAYENSSYKKLIRNSIHWVSRNR